MVVEFMGPSEVLGVNSLGNSSLTIQLSNLARQFAFQGLGLLESIATSPLAIETFRVGRESDPKEVKCNFGSYA